MLPKPPVDAGKYAPLLALCESILVTPDELAKHWRMSRDYLANVRRAGRGTPHIKLPTGRVLYRLSDVLAAELGGTAGDITLERIELALAAMPRLPADTRAAVIEHLKGFFATGR